VVDLCSGHPRASGGARARRRRPSIPMTPSPSPTAMHRRSRGRRPCLHRAAPRPDLACSLRPPTLPPAASPAGEPREAVPPLPCSLPPARASRWSHGGPDARELNGIVGTGAAAEPSRREVSSSGGLFSGGIEVPCAGSWLSCRAAPPLLPFPFLPARLSSFIDAAARGVAAAVPNLLRLLRQQIDDTPLLFPNLPCRGGEEQRRTEVGPSQARSAPLDGRCIWRTCAWNRTSRIWWRTPVRGKKKR
jgi:hypothetical protein